MKGTIRMKVTPRKEGPRIRTAVRLRQVGMMDKLFLVRSFLGGAEDVCRRSKGSFGSDCRRCCCQ